MKKKSTQRIAAWLLAAGMMAGTFAQPMAVYAESTASVAASDSTTGDSITADADVVIATPTPEPDTGTDTAATPVPAADSQTPQDPASTAAPETTPAPDAAEDAPTPTPTPAAEDTADDAADTDDTTDTTTTVTLADLQSCIALLAASQLSLDADSIEPDVREETLALSDEITETEPSTLQAVVNAAVFAAPADQTDINVDVPANNYTGTLVNAVLYHCQGSLSGINGVLRPGIVHRIDRNTTGSLIICKNDKAHQCIADQLKVHSITRKYRAIVHGRLTEDGVVHTTIGRHPLNRKEMAVNVPNGKDAVTHYHVLETFDKFTYIECQLETGRTHQIRVHMKSIGHPILGDDVYGPAKCPFPGLEGQTLHAMTIGFLHPTTGNYMEFEAPLPDYFEQLLKKLRGLP